MKIIKPIKNAIIKKRILNTFDLVISSLIIVAQNQVRFEITTNPNSNDPALGSFTKYVNVFGLGIYAESSISDEKTLHAAAPLPNLKRRMCCFRS